MSREVPFLTLDVATKVSLRRSWCRTSSSATSAPVPSWLDTGIKAHDGGLGVPFDSLLARPHGDPRWMPFLRKIGKTPEQSAVVKFTVTIPAE
jgi:hypothetical protein